MGTAQGSATDAPDAGAIISLLTERLHDTGQDMPEIRPNGSIVMLMGRFSPALRQRLYGFLQDCISDDLIYTKNLILKNAAEPNRFLSMVHAIGAVREINRGWSGHGKPAATDLLTAYRELWMQELDEEANLSSLNQIIGVHLARAIGVNDTEFGISLATFFPRYPDFLDGIGDAVPALTALMEQYSVNDYSTKKIITVFEVAAYVREHHDDAERITSVIRSRKGFDRHFMDELLAEKRSPIEDGKL